MATHGPEAAAVIEAYGRIVKEFVGGKAGELLRLRGWQRSLLDAMLAEDDAGRLVHGTALVGQTRNHLSKLTKR